MSSYSKDLRRIVNDYRDAGGDWPATTEAIAAWAIRQERWQPHPRQAIRQCSRDISRALREEYFTDAQGRRVRAKHPRKERGRNGKNLNLWDDIRTAPRSHMETSFVQRRERIVGDCRQLKIDVDSYNDANQDQEPIQLEFDFTLDLLELEAAEAA